MSFNRFLVPSWLELLPHPGSQVCFSDSCSLGKRRICFCCSINCWNGSCCCSPDHFKRDSFCILVLRLRPDQLAHFLYHAWAAALISQAKNKTVRQTSVSCGPFSPGTSLWEHIEFKQNKNSTSKIKAATTIKSPHSYSPAGRASAPT